MYLRFEKSYEDSIKVIYNLKIMEHKGKCIVYKNTGAIEIDPTIIKQYSCEEYFNSKKQLSYFISRIIGFLYKCSKYKKYPDTHIIENCIG